MNPRYIVFGLAVIIVALLALFIFVPGRMPGNNSVPTPPASAGIPDLFEVTSPQLNEAITSPVMLTGRARGTWYFEASFPVKIVDAKGKVLAQQPIMATGDWMTENFVPFTATVSFMDPGATTGKIIFMKDNPSGLPQNERSYELPIRFK